MSDAVQNTLDERNESYGDFNETARIAQNIKAAFRDSPNWDKLDPVKKEAMEMDATKIARILNGNPEHNDGWHDREGYLRLVTNNLHDTLFSKQHEDTPLEDRRYHKPHPFPELQKDKVVSPSVHRCC